MSFVLIRGGGDIASGVVVRLHQSGFPVMITELPKPLAVRRRICFASAVYAGSIRVEDCLAWRVDDPIETPQLIDQIAAKGGIPVLVDPDGEAIKEFRPKVVVDGRMLKRHLVRQADAAQMLIGLGPGFVAGENCDAVIETSFGSSMGTVIWKGPAQPNNSMPERIAGHQESRVLRAPVDGPVKTYTKIGDHVVAGQTIAEVDGHFITAAFSGILRGLIYPGLRVKSGMRIGEIDPRDDESLCAQITDKSRVVAGGVLEAISSKFDLLDFTDRSTAAVQSVSLKVNGNSENRTLSRL
jgi:xanthine dehydrogenase accessory factor